MYMSYMGLWAAVAKRDYLLGNTGAGEHAMLDVVRMVAYPLPILTELGISITAIAQAMQCIIISPRLLQVAWLSYSLEINRIFVRCDQYATADFLADLSAGHCCRWSGALLRTFRNRVRERRAAEGIAAHHSALPCVCHDWELERRSASGVYMFPDLLLGSQPLLPRSLCRQCSQVWSLSPAHSLQLLPICSALNKPIWEMFGIFIYIFMSNFTSIVLIL